MTASPRLDRDPSLYKVDGCRIPSVTECLAIAGMIDFRGVDAETLAAAAERGRLAHRITAMWDQGNLRGGDELPAGYEDVGSYLLAYSKFREETKAKPVRIEHGFTHRGFRFAGTVDRVFILPDGALWIVDLKSGALLAGYVGLQTAGYSIGMMPEFPGHLNVKRFALRLLPDASYRLVRCKDATDATDFMACVRVAHRRLRDKLATLEIA